MIDYRIATSDDMQQVAIVHEKCFPEYFTTLFGSELLAKYYEEFLKETPLFVVAVDDNNLIGFCMGYDRRIAQAKNKFIQNNKATLSRRIIKLCISFNKLAIKKSVDFIKSRFTKKKPALVNAEGDLLSICVLDDYKGKGIATALVNCFEKALLQNSICDYTLGVYKDNLGAIKFYKKMGMSIAAEDDEEYKFYKKL